MAYGAKYYAMRGDPGFLGGLARTVGRVAGTVGKIPGLSTVVRALPGVGTIATLAGPAIGLAKKVGAGMSGARALASPAAATTRALVPYDPGFAAGQAGRMLASRGRMMLTGGAAAAGAAGGYAAARRMAGVNGGGGRRYRRMNPLNPKAANRAIRRIKAVRKVCTRIESQLPKRRARAASPFKRRGR